MRFKDVVAAVKADLCSTPGALQIHVPALVHPAVLVPVPEHSEARAGRVYPGCCWAGEGLVLMVAAPSPRQHLTTGWPTPLTAPALARSTGRLEQSGDVRAVLEDDGGEHEADPTSGARAPHDLCTDIPAVHGTWMGAARERGSELLRRRASGACERCASIAFSAATRPRFPAQPSR